MPGGRGPYRIVAIAALSTGAALVVHILSGISLPAALLGTLAILVGAATLRWRTASLGQRARLLTRVKVGAAAGVIALVTYDVVKLVLSRLDPSPLNPFEAIPVFGALLLGTGAAPLVATVVGAAYHAANGVAFGIAFCVLFGHRGVLAGIGWGLLLEVFQLALYPGWLGIQLYREFLQISAVSHVAYGAVLGLLCQRWLARIGELS